MRVYPIQVGAFQKKNPVHYGSFRFFMTAYVAAHLRGLRAEDPSKKGHPRPLEQKLKLFRH